jgi:hypothetical protein
MKATLRRMYARLSHPRDSNPEPGDGSASALDEKQVRGGAGHRFRKSLAEVERSVR